MTRPSCDDPEHLRERAEEARAIAEQMIDEQSRASMLRAPLEYDLLATTALARLTVTAIVGSQPKQ
jgi:hypothetical protein